jgi:hypothetical protein
MCVDCVLTSPRIAQVDPGDRPLPEVVLSRKGAIYIQITVATGVGDATTPVAYEDHSSIEPMR